MDEKSETWYMSAYECNLQEFNYQITSNYEHLCELSHSKKSPSEIKPFLDCMDKLFSMLLTRIQFKQFTNEESNDEANFLFESCTFNVHDRVIERPKCFPAICVSNSFQLSDSDTSEKGLFILFYLAVLFFEKL